MNNSELDMSSVSPIISGLSHHNVHLNMYIQQQTDLLSISVSQRQYDVQEVMNTQTYTHIVTL